MGQGLTGWLTPEGEFHTCLFGNHHELAYEFMNNEELRKEQTKARLHDSLYQHEDEFLRRVKAFIPMGVDPQSNDSYLHMPIDEKTCEPMVTEQQKRWFKDHFEEFTVIQQSVVAGWLEDLFE